MDLLNQKSMKNEDENAKEMAEEIIKVLHEFSISKEDLKIAEKFFDASREMDLSLLDKLSFHDFLLEKNINSEWKCHDIVEKDYKKYPEMVGRFVLYLDALGKNTIGDKLAAFPLHLFSCYQDEEASKIEHGSKKAVAIRTWDGWCRQVTVGGEAEFIFSSLRRRYDENMMQSKVAALLSVSRYNDYSYNFALQKMAKENPMNVLRAIDTCCQGEGADWKSTLQLYALGLGAIPADAKEKEAKDYISRGVMFLLDIADKLFEQENLTDIECKLLIAACFCMYPHSQKVEALLTRLATEVSFSFLVQSENGIQREIAMAKEEPFIILEPLTYFMPESYLNLRMEKILEILETENDKNFLKRCILWLVDLLYTEDIMYEENKGNAALLLHILVTRKPKQYVEVMYMTEPTKVLEKHQIRYGRFVPCMYYKELYELLEQIHPECIKEYGLEKEKDMKNLSVEVIVSCYQDRRQELRSFLEEKCTLEEILPLPEKTGFWDEWIEDILMPCRKENPEFDRRYVAISSISAPSFINNWGEVDEQKGEEAYREFIQKLLDAKVPVHYRFAAYDPAGYLTEETGNKCLAAVIEMMVKHQDIYEEEYKTLWKNGGLITKKACLSYLIKTREKEGHKDIILSMSGSQSSKDWLSYYVQEVSACPEYEEGILSLLKAKKQFVRETAVNILVKWGAEKYKDILLEAADTEKSAKLADKIRSYVDTALLNQSLANPSSETSAAKLVENIHDGGRAKKLSWLYKTPNPTVHFVNGQEAEDKYLQAILLCYHHMEKLGLNQNAEFLVKELNDQEFAVYAHSIYNKWLEDGAQFKERWVLYFYAIHGGMEVLTVLGQCIKEWAENSRGAIAAEAVNAMVLNGSSQALMQIDHMAHKFKHKQVKKAAVQALEHAAEELGITSEELGDRIVPNLGFDQNMEQIYDYGTRKFRVYLTPSLELEIFDEDGKKRKSMPAPGTKDDAQKAKLANTEFKQMKKQLKSIVAMQKFRLENALLSGRCWDTEGWKALFVANPVMHSFAIGLIWTAYSQGERLTTFRYMEDGTFNTVDEEEYELPEGAVIGLAHPIEMAEEELEGWKEQLSDYEIVQPIMQLEKKIYLLEEDEKQSLDLNRFHGRKIHGLSLHGRAAKFGWSKGSVEDAGVFYTFYREDVTKRIKEEDDSVRLEGNAVELQFSGMYVGMFDNEEDVEIENVRFYHPGTVDHGSYVYDRADDKKAIPLGEVEPRYMSEMLGQLEEMTKN